MESVQDITRELAFVTLGLVLPQVLGYMAYRWVRKTSMPMKSAVMLIPPIAFYITASLFWRHEAAEIRRQEHYVCGLFGTAEMLSTYLGTLFHLIISAVLFVIYRGLWKRKQVRLQVSAG
jgi:hypothetical protein